MRLPIAWYVVLTLVAMLGLPSTAWAYNYQTCVKLKMTTNDSGFTIPSGPDMGLDEDHWTTCNSDCKEIARGIRVKISRLNIGQPAFEETFDADPTTGCFNWSSTYTNGFTMVFYAYATNVRGTYVRVHDDPDDFSSYPGTTQAWTLLNQTPTNGGSNTYEIGSYSELATTFGSLAFGIYRFDAQLYNKAIHAALDYTANCSSSSSYDESNDYITSGRGYMKIESEDAPCGSNDSRQKFLITHELGHILLRLHANRNGGEIDDDSTRSVSPNDITCDGSGNGYAIDDNEHSVVAWKEGFAHFVSARIWNDKASSGLFQWNGTHDLERYGGGAGTSSGGRLENECCVEPDDVDCTDSWAGGGTIEDWMRFLWDFYTNVDGSGICNSQPDGLDMFDIYKQVRDNHASLCSGGSDPDCLTKGTYFTKTDIAAAQIGLPSCLSGGRFDEYAVWNGVNNVP
jgi:hypothetical protein